MKLSKFLTGWNTTAEADLSGEGERLNSVFYFCNNFHESEEVDIFGVFYKSSSTAEESYERIRKMLEALSMHPLTAKFFCKKILGHFVRGAYSEKDLDELIAKYYECGGHVGELLVHLLQKDYFYNSSKDQYMIPPLDFAISVMANSTDPDIWAILNCGKKSGFGLFDSIDPSGHPEEDQYYADSNVILQCWRLSDQANWHLYRNLPESLHIARGKPEPEWMNDMIHTASMRLNGKSLDSNSYTVTKDYFKDLEGQTYLKVLGLVSFIKKLPVAYTK